MQIKLLEIDRNTLKSYNCVQIKLLLLENNTLNH